MLWKAKSKQVPPEQKVAQSQPRGRAEYKETAKPSLSAKAPSGAAWVPDLKCPL